MIETATYEVHQPGISDYWTVLNCNTCTIVALFHDSLPGAGKLARDLADKLNRFSVQ